MILNKKTLEKLRELINEKTQYRSGPMLVNLFNELGFNDKYGQGFPSRKSYTDAKLSLINGTPQIDECIKRVFSPNEFINQYSKLDELIGDFNQYLVYDGWEIRRKGINITFLKCSEVDIDKEIITKKSESAESFLSINYKLSIEKISLNPALYPVIDERINEIEKCMRAESPLAVIFLAGSTLEGILLNMATLHPVKYNTANSSPKDSNGKVKPFVEWKLSQFIDVSYEIGFLREDVRRFSHGLRDFRNFIHPYEQMSKNFHPDKHTAAICFQVLKAAIHQISMHF